MLEVHAGRLGYIEAQGQGPDALATFTFPAILAGSKPARCTGEDSKPLTPSQENFSNRWDACEHPPVASKSQQL